MFLLAAAFAIIILWRSGGWVQLHWKSGLFVFLFTLVCIELVNTHIVAPKQPLYLTLIEAFPYISVCLEAYVLSKLLVTRDDLKWFLCMIEKASILIACFSILQFILYPDIIIFPTEALPYRNGLPRIYVGGGSILSVGVLISMGNVLSRRKGVALSWINLILALITLAVVRQARSNTACLLCVFMLAVIHQSNLPKVLRIVLYFCVGALLFIVYIFIDGNTLIMSFAQEDAGIQARINGIRFFLDKFAEYPIFGMGFITSSGNLDPVSYALLCSPSGYHFDRSDVGIVGVLNLFGICGVVWYCLFLVRLGRNGSSMYRTSGTIHGKVFLWYMIVTMANLIVLTMQKTMIIALTIVITDKLQEFSVRSNERTVL